jgi:hypothetical protein
MRTTLKLLYVLMLVWPANANPQSIGAAPLGLQWGLSLEETQKLGVELTVQKDDNYGKAVVFTKLPQILADQEVALGSYGYDDRLWRIVIISKVFSSDPSGYAVLDRYSALSALLSEKYGKSTSVHRKGDSIYAEQGYFISGIRSGKTFWYSDFKAENLSVQLGIVANDSSDSRWRIIYENGALRGSFDRARRSREKGAL